MLSTDHLGIKGQSKHLKDHYIGPYPVIRMVGPNAVELVLPGHLKIHPVINTERLRPYHEPLSGQPVSRPKPVIVDKEIEYEVERIIGMKGSGHGRHFLVKWSGYPDSDNTWEPKRNLSNAKEKLTEFLRSHTA